MRIGICGAAGGWSSQRLTEAFAARGAETLPLEAAALSLELRGNGIEVRHGGAALPRLDAVAVKKIGDVQSRAATSRLEALRALEGLGVVVRSPTAAIARAVDRVTMTRTLAGAGIPIPRTLVTWDPEEAHAFLASAGRAVLKPIFTSKGRGMARLEPGTAARDTLQAAASGSDEPLYLQEFVEASERTDLGIALLAGQVVGGYRRVAPASSWMTTIAQGGSYAPYVVPPEIAKLARHAAAPFGLTFTGVDVVLGPGGPRVYEVSAFGGFRGLFETAGIDGAALFAEHVLGELAATGTRPSA